MAHTKSQSSAGDILQQINRVKCEIGEARQQALYRHSAKITCFLHGYMHGEFSFILNLESTFEVNHVPSIAAYGWQGTATVKFTVCISHRNSRNVADWLKSQKDEMFVRNVEVVKRPNGVSIPSVVRLNFRYDTVKQGRATLVYLNVAKGTFDVISRVPDREFSVLRKPVGQTSTDRVVPREVHRTSGVVNCIPDNQREIIESKPEIWDFMYQRLSAIHAVLDCRGVSFFQRENSGVQVRDVFLGPLNLKSGVSVRHSEECSK